MTVATIVERALRGKRVIVLCPTWPNLEVAMTVETVAPDIGALRIVGRSDSGALFSRRLFATTQIKILTNDVERTSGHHSR